MGTTKEINLTEADEGSFSISKRGKNDKVSLPKVRVVKKTVKPRFSSR